MFAEERVNILGTIPFMHPGRASVEQHAKFADSFLGLRRTLRSHFASGESIAVTITSLHPREGTTFVAANLSLNFAEAGFRTLLIDGDHRGNGASSWFGVPSTPGFVDHRRGDAGLDTVVRSTNYDRCFVLPYGDATRPTPCEAIDAQVSLMDELRARFDVVIIDSPRWGSDPALDSLVSQTTGCGFVRRDGESAVDGNADVTLRGALPPVRMLGHILIAAE